MYAVDADVNLCWRLMWFVGCITIVPKFVDLHLWLTMKTFVGNTVSVFHRCGLKRLWLISVVDVLLVEVLFQVVYRVELLVVE